MANEDIDRESVMDGVRRIEADVNTLHKDVKKFEEKLLALEQKAAEAGLPRLEYTLRDAYVRASKACGKMVEAHLALRMHQPQLEGEEQQVTPE